MALLGQNDLPVATCDDARAVTAAIRSPAVGFHSAEPVSVEVDIRVVAGDEGAGIGVEQAAAMVEVLEWIARYQARNSSGPGSPAVA
jgi:hypothetical protein